MSGFSSTSSFTTLSFPALSRAISSRAGAIWRHGPHHAAQKSTSTGTGDSSTSWWKLPSVTATVFAIEETPPSRTDRIRPAHTWDAKRRPAVHSHRRGGEHRDVFTQRQCLGNF